MTETNIRPTFLTVLCILTFIGSGWGIVDSLIDYFNADLAGDTVNLVEEQMDEALEDIEDDEKMTDSQKELVEGLMGGITDSLTPENIRKSSLISAISNLLTLLGAVLMWQLRKNGYWLYILGVLVMVVGMAIVFQGLVGIAAAGATGFFGVVFIVLYGVNLKHMH